MTQELLQGHSGERITVGLWEPEGLRPIEAPSLMGAECGRLYHTPFRRRRDRDYRLPTSNSLPSYKLTWRRAREQSCLSNDHDAPTFARAAVHGQTEEVDARGYAVAALVYSTPGDGVKAAGHGAVDQ